MTKATTAGFTLLEAVVAAFLLLLCLSLLSLAIQGYQKVRQLTFKERQLEWHLFLNQFEAEIEGAICLQVSSEKVTFQKNPEKPEQFFYEKYQQMIRYRTSNGSGGHQPILMKVKKISFHREGTFLRIKVVFTNQEEFQALQKIQFNGKE